ncbi:MAG: hypothetical protein C4523_15235 [Myxococcales bacterium]|nr:MAG: hypothetical protein C4523_15235 [Myxococcales bacterium]
MNVLPVEARRPEGCAARLDAVAPASRFVAANVVYRLFVLGAMAALLVWLLLLGAAFLMILPIFLLVDYARPGRRVHVIRMHRALRQTWSALRLR